MSLQKLFLTAALTGVTAFAVGCVPTTETQATKPRTTETQATKPRTTTSPATQESTPAREAQRDGAGHKHKKPVEVQGYTRKDGKHVEPYTRALPGEGRSHKR
jgi:hypothetical protein